MKYLTIAVLLFFVNVNAQTKFNSESFEVTKEELELNVFDKDSTANALVIREIGSTDVNSRTYFLETEVEKKIKIFNKNGFDFGEVSLTLFDDNDGQKESIKNIKATVYNLKDGEIEKTKLKKTSVFEEAVNDNITSVKIVFPKVKEGSIIVFSYKKISPFMYKYEGWEFQDVIPKLYSEYNASISRVWEYHAKLVGNLKFTTEEHSIDKYCMRFSGSGGECNVSKYVIENVPAFIEEDYMTTKNNYLSRIEYELKTVRGAREKHITQTWDAVDNKILNETALGRELHRTNTHRALIEKKVLSLDSPLERAKTIYKYVQDNFKWNGVERIFEGVSTKYLVENKTGNVGSINMLLYLMLNEFEIDVKLLILSTRDNGFATTLYPVISDFNYLIIKAEIDGETYLLDATNKYLSFGELPFRCLNHYGRVLDFFQGSEWYDINVKDASIQQFSCVLDLDKDQNITGQIDFEASGYHALPLKTLYFENSEAFIDGFTNEFNLVDITDFKVATTEKTSITFSSTFDIENTTDLIGNTLYLNPILFKFFSKNPFGLQERTYPIDFGYKDTYIYKIKINVDSSYTIKELPEPVNLTLPNRDAGILFSAQQKDNQVLLYFKLTFNKALYASDYYEALKEIMSKVIDIQNNTIIVLDKKQ
ncbi:DUF3857 domain-containing protein [uncultured Psychroserpens sp.]|uniref:DUF3857 domain-containing protein n=1 Tax=uncultured Psychroserpens sp. TaxID=255436 RepID=UPI002615A408|nr:DUF3857 domain-containing protein [uncultured Psychroserpens sp.]